MDRVHDQGGLDAHGRAVAAVDGLDLTGDQAIGHVIDPGAAVFFGQRRAEEAQGPHLVHDLAVEALLGIGRDHPGQELFTAIGPGTFPDHAFVLGQARGEIEGIFPVEGLLRDPGVEGHGLSPCELFRGLMTGNQVPV